MKVKPITNDTQHIIVTNVRSKVQVKEIHTKEGIYELVIARAPRFSNFREEGNFERFSANVFFWGRMMQSTYRKVCRTRMNNEVESCLIDWTVHTPLVDELSPRTCRKRCFLAIVISDSTCIFAHVSSGQC